MFATREAPSKEELLAALRDHTPAEVCEELEIIGHPQSIGSLRSMRSRAGLANATKPRALPWGPVPAHRGHYDYRMCRHLQHFLAGDDVPAAQLPRLESWLAPLIAGDLVVTYSPEEGFGRRKRRYRMLGKTRVYLETYIEMPVPESSGGRHATAEEPREDRPTPGGRHARPVGRL